MPGLELIRQMATINFLPWLAILASNGLIGSMATQDQLFLQFPSNNFLVTRDKRDATSGMHELGRSSVLSRSKAMQSWGEDTFRDIIRDELSVTSEQNQGYHNTTNKLIFYDLEEGDGPKPSVSQAPAEDLNKRKVARFPYKEGIQRDEPDGCGRPVCALIDTRPMRFSSLCQLVKTMSDEGHYHRILHVQKGDCADAIEDVGLDRVWSNKPRQCRECRDQDTDGGCGTTICVATSKDSIARTYDNVCAFYEDFHNAKEVVTIHIGLGSCTDIFNQGALLYTEWFDLDEPCLVGDIEHVLTNIAYVSNFEKTAPFRICPKKFREKGKTEFQTTQGTPVPIKQIVDQNFKEEKLVCENSKQLDKPGPPNFWYHKKIKCMDYKMRHQCECLYGCLHQKDDHTEKMQVKIVLPKIKTLFDECEWRPFVDTSTPDNSTWDAEVRGTILRKHKVLAQHVCNDNNVDAMYIDTRRVEDDIPWHETGELMTKNTPTFGSLCINKNNAFINKQCSDYKTRFCCRKQESASWGAWNDWSQCSKSCGGGTQFTTRRCKEPPSNSNGKTCFGNWKDVVDGKDRMMIYKKLTRPCNQKDCPMDAVMQDWQAWDPCTVTCGKGTQKRRRFCSAAVNNGKTCPDRRKNIKLYVQVKDCQIKSCPDPMWTAWTATDCTVSCGVGTFTKSRNCEDFNTGDKMDPFLDCGATDQTDLIQTEKCEKPHCPVDGGLTEWQNWSNCNIACGPGGKQKRHRYCTNPMPQNGGRPCRGRKEESRECKNLPCPINCEFSQWGTWMPCSVTCGPVGHGTQIRRRHISQKSKYGGIPCPSDSIMSETRKCRHVNMPPSEKKGEKNLLKNCPVDCKYYEWSCWSQPCEPCIDERRGQTRARVENQRQHRHRREEVYAQYGGKECDEELSQTRHCKDIPDYSLGLRKCDNKDDSKAYYTEWQPWSRCAGQCGHPGFMTRIRHCQPGQKDQNMKCDGPPQESKKCVTFCPSTGWGMWEPWTKCSVTCGKGPQTRRRRCLDELRGEMKNRSTCAGKQVDNQRQMCDLGPCAGDPDSGMDSVTTEKTFRKKFAQRRRRRRRRKNGKRRLMKGKRGRRRRPRRRPRRPA